MRRLLNVRPNGRVRILLGALPILLLVLVYVGASSARHSANPSDKILPTFAAMADQVRTMGFHVDPLTGKIPLVADTAASLGRLAAGVGLATATALALGMAIGLLPVVLTDVAHFERPRRCPGENEEDASSVAGALRQRRDRRVDGDEPGRIRAQEVAKRRREAQRRRDEEEARRRERDAGGEHDARARVAPLAPRVARRPGEPRASAR